MCLSVHRPKELEIIRIPPCYMPEEEGNCNTCGRAAASGCKSANTDALSDDSGHYTCTADHWKRIQRDIGTSNASACQGMPLKDLPNIRVLPTLSTTKAFIALPNGQMLYGSFSARVTNIPRSATCKPHFPGLLSSRARLRVPDRRSWAFPASRDRF
jgi:hypothetical protein